MDYSDFIIPLAWPEAFVRSAWTAGGWCDGLFARFHLQKNGFYKAGHTAFLLVNSSNGDIDYFDFGRYISPEGYGRARSKETDPELSFTMKAQIHENEIINMKDIIRAIGTHLDTHGEGALYAGIQDRVNYSKAISFVRECQSAPCVPYGPFIVKGTNCARFVAQTIAHAIKGSGFRFLYPWHVTPAPLGTIFNSSKKVLYRFKESTGVSQIAFPGAWDRFRFLVGSMRFKRGEKTPSVMMPLHPPCERKNVSSAAQWLGGIEAGAWYEVTKISSHTIEVKRTQSSGRVDFVHDFHGPVKKVDFSSEYSFEFGSHGTQVVLSQEGRLYEFAKL